MRIGVQTYIGGETDRALLETVQARGHAIEVAGLDSIWVSEHVVSFEDYSGDTAYPYSSHGLPPDHLSNVGMLDPFITLTALASCTKRLRLATGVALLPLRNPVHFAKMATSLQLLSGGRFTAGVGLGWSRREYDAVGAEWSHRGVRMDESIAVISTLWSQRPASYTGTHVHLPPCLQLPMPAAAPRLVIGGESEAALSRAVRLGQGWFGYRLTVEEALPLVERLRLLMAAADRDFAELEIIVSPGRRDIDADALAGYEALGVSEVVLPCPSQDSSEFLEQLGAVTSLSSTVREN